MNNRSSSREQNEETKKKWGEIAGKDSKKEELHFIIVKRIGYKNSHFASVRQQLVTEHRTHRSSVNCARCVSIDWISIIRRSTFHELFVPFPLTPCRRRRLFFFHFFSVVVYGVNHAAFSNSYEIHLHSLWPRQNRATRIFEQNTEPKSPEQMNKDRT